MKSGMHPLRSSRRIVALGRFGRKTGQGFYDWSEERPNASSRLTEHSVRLPLQGSGLRRLAALGRETERSPPAADAARLRTE